MEPWIAIWIFFAIGLFIIAVAAYDLFDRKKRGQPIKVWKYLLAAVIGLAFMLPILSGPVLWLFRRSF